jgi:hypothetical protein
MQGLAVEVRGTRYEVRGTRYENDRTGQPIKRSLLAYDH